MGGCLVSSPAASSVRHSLLAALVVTAKLEGVAAGVPVALGRRDVQAPEAQAALVSHGVNAVANGPGNGDHGPAEPPHATASTFGDGLLELRDLRDMGRRGG